MICFNYSERNHEIFDERIAKWHFQPVASMPIGLVGKYAEAAEVGNINSWQLLDNWPRSILWPTLSSRQLRWHCHLNSIALCDLLETGNQIVICGNCGLNHAGCDCNFLDAHLQ